MNSQKLLLAESRGFIAKWGFIDCIKSDLEKATVAVLLENQTKQFNATSTNSEQWANVSMPIIRRLYSEFASIAFL